MRAEDQRRGRAVSGQRVHEFAGDSPRVDQVAHADFFGQREALQPFEQPAAQTADDAQLRKVNVRIDEAGQQHTAAKIAYRRPPDAPRARPRNRRTRDDAAGDKQRRHP